MTWKPNSWRNYPVVQMPTYPDESKVNSVEAKLSFKPPLVFAGEVQALKKSLALAEKGNAFILQGGDCAESFSQFSANGIRDTFKVLLQMAVILTYGSSIPIIKIGRIAGQFAKPRSSDVEIIDGIELEELIEKRTFGLMNPNQKEKIIANTKKEFPNGINSFGTDAMRFTFCSLASGSRDINFDMKRVEGYRNFCNKLWNASRFIEMQIENSGVSEKPHDDLIEKWINYKFNLTVKKVNDAFESFRFDLATKAIYEFIWYEFCDWYIELNKVRLSEPNAKKPEIVKSMIDTLEQTLKLVHPLMPFVTEEIWKQFKIYFDQKDESLMPVSYTHLTLPTSDLV